jgi:polar amino acid transport system substrate-binding protein
MRCRIVCRIVATTTFLGVALTACDLPRDPEGTAARVRGAALRVGLVENAPWVVHGADGPTGVEVDLVRALASDLGATPQWTWGGEQRLLQSLADFELDVVVGGLTDDTPWSSDVGLTGDFLEERIVRGGATRTVRHVLATPPGENEWIARLDRFLAAHQHQVHEQYAKAPR